MAAAGPVRGIWTQTLAEDFAIDAYTGLMHYDPGVDTSPLGTRIHAYWEEVYLLEGDLTDLCLGETFSAEMYARRPPGMPHGPWRTEHGVLMLEVRSARAVSPKVSSGYHHARAGTRASVTYSQLHIKSSSANQPKKTATDKKSEDPGQHKQRLGDTFSKASRWITA